MTKDLGCEEILFLLKDVGHLQKTHTRYHLIIKLSCDSILILLFLINASIPIGFEINHSDFSECGNRDDKYMGTTAPGIQN
jgi:hypothetical protein